MIKKTIHVWDFLMTLQNEEIIWLYNRLIIYNVNVI